MDKIKILIVDDSAFMRKVIADFFAEDHRFEVVGTARNGEDAIKKIQQLKPSVVTMDVEMPIMNGLEALKIIMKEHPIPVIMLSSTTKEGAENTLLAIQYGAVDFIAKPSGAISLDLYKVKHELIEKVLAASKANLKQLIKSPLLGKKTITLSNDCSKIEPIIPMIPSKSTPANPAGQSAWKTRSKKILLIGTSTGGPGALQNVLTKLPRTINVPILVVQHMPPGFTKSLATRLDSLCEIDVKEAEEGEILHKGTCYIAPGGYHLKVKSIGTSLAVDLDRSDPRNGHRPSVDVMFESAANLQDYEKIVVVMTGMGSDGAKGLVTLKNSGQTRAIAESKETSIVFGMPKAAIATGLIDEIENVENITSAIMKYV